MFAFWNGFWAEVAVVALAIFAVYTARQTNRVIYLKPLKLPRGKGEPPNDQSRVDQKLMDLGFGWLGDFDASSNSAVVTSVRVYATPDWLYQAIFVSSRNSEEELTMVEFNCELEQGGNLCTSNNKQPGIYSYPLNKLVTRAPWKKKVADLFELHKKLCEAAASQGFAPRPISPESFSALITDGSRKDFEGERKLGRMEEIDSEVYTTTLKGAIIYAPRIWLPMAYGFLYGWYHPSDKSLAKRAQERFRRAAKEIH